jgi:hypothetical protein
MATSECDRAQAVDERGSEALLPPSAIAEPYPIDRIVRSDQTEIVREVSHRSLVHVRGRRKAMDKRNRRLAGSPASR